MNFKKFLLIVIIPVLVLGLLVYFFTKKETIKVKKITSQTTDVLKTVSSSGSIKSTVESQVAFPVSGKLVNVYKKEGETVKSGDLIAQVYNEDYYFDAQSYKKRKDAAQKARDIYIENYSGDHNEVGGTELYEDNVKKLTDELRVQDNLYKSSLATLKKTYLYSPFDGTITKMPYDLGEVVSTNNSIIVSDLNALEFQADLDQEDYKFVKQEQESEIVLDSYPDDIFKGKIISVPFYVDEDSATRTFKLKISIQNIDNKIVKGMTGDVNIVVDKVSNTKALPFDAVFTEEGSNKTFVWIVNSSNQLTKQYIEIGLEGDTLTQIKSEIPEFVVVPDSSSKTIKEGALASF
jgi:membrane fusion protein (multidrug efflux system)